MRKNLEKNVNLKLINSLQIINSWLSDKSKRNIYKLTLFSIFVGILEVTSLMSIGPILSVFNSNNTILSSLYYQNNPKFLFLLLSILFAIFINIVSFFKIKTISYSHFLSAKIGQEIGRKLLKNFLGQELLDHKSKESTTVINTFTHHLSQTVRFIIFFLQLIVSLLGTICIFTFLVIENPIVIIGTFSFIGSIYLLFANKYKIKNLESAKNTKFALDKIASIIQEITSNIEKYILEYKDYETLERFTQYDHLLRISIARSRNYTLLPRYVIEASAISSFIILTCLNSLLFDVDNLTLIAKLSVSIFGIQKILPSINLIYQSWNLMCLCIPSVYSVKDLISDDADLSRSQLVDKDYHHFKETIKLKNICFKYKKEKFVLNQFNLRINKGDKILIRGKSGLGKTTLINIICSLIKPQRGKIYIDNKLLGEEIAYSEWRRQISIVKQKPFFRSGNILNLILGENICLDEQSSISKAKYYAKLACIDDVIESLPDGYLQYVEEDGKSLSGGQMQRIAIANALCLKPSLLILDESTSGVDKDTESKIFNNIFEIEDITVLAISHSKNLESIFKNYLSL